MTVNYEKEAKWFIKCAFDLLHRYENRNDQTFAKRPYLERHLIQSYFIRIMEYGKFSLVKGFKTDDGPTRYRIISHTFEAKTSSMTRIGSLLTVYLTYLEMDALDDVRETKNSNESGNNH